MKLTEKKPQQLQWQGSGLFLLWLKCQIHFKVSSLLVVAIYSLYKKHKLYTSIRALNITAQQACTFQTGPLWMLLSKECTLLFIDIYIKI